MRFLTLSILSLTFFVSTAFAQDLTTRNTDVDGDGLGDIITYDSGSATFYVRQSSDLQTTTTVVGNVGDKPAVADYDGDGVAELVTFNPSTGAWSGLSSPVTLGSIADFPVPGAYDGLNCLNLATYNQKTAFWTVADCDGSNARAFILGGPNHIPVPDDYDCDGQTDPAVFNRLTSQWTIVPSTTDIAESFFYGLPGDIPVPGRYTRANCADIAVHRPMGNFYLIADGYTVGGLGNVASVFQWGLPGDYPVLMNVEGDDLLDLTVFRPLDKNYYISTSTNFFFLVPFTEQPTNRVAQPISATPLFDRKIPGDYNRDGKSDFVFASVDSTLRRTTFNILHGGTNEVSTHVLNTQGDAIVSADYDGDGTIDPAVVFVESDATLTWNIYQADGTEDTSSFGLNGDQPVGGDFDCDGKADKAVVRQDGFFKYWYFEFAKGDTLDGVLFGIENDTIHVADVNGDGCDEMIVSRDAFGGIDWWYRNLLDGEDIYVQWGLVGDELLTPADVNGDGRADFIVARDAGGFRIIFAYLGDGVSTTYTFATSTGILMTGHFSGVNFSEFASYDRTTGQFLILRAHFLYDGVTFGDASDAIIRPDGSVVQPGTNGGGGSVACDVTSDFFDGGGGALWKPVSESTGNPVILLPANYWDDTASIEVFSSTGEFIVNGTFRTCCPNDNRAHFDIPRSANALAPFRPIIVRFNLKNGTRECRVVEDPRNRDD